MAPEDPCSTEGLNDQIGLDGFTGSSGHKSKFASRAQRPGGPRHPDDVAKRQERARLGNYLKPKPAGASFIAPPTEIAGRAKAMVVGLAEERKLELSSGIPRRNQNDRILAAESSCLISSGEAMRLRAVNHAANAAHHGRWSDARASSEPPPGTMDATVCPGCFASQDIVNLGSLAKIVPSEGITALLFGKWRSFAMAQRLNRLEHCLET